MSRLPSLSAREVVAAFAKAGFHFQRQTGGHLILYSPARRQILSVPNHDAIKRGTLRSLIRYAGLTHQQFLDLLR